MSRKEQKPVHTAKEMWKEMRLEVYAHACGNRHEPNYADDSTKMFSLCDIDEIFEKIGNSTVGSQPAEWSEEDEKMRLDTIRAFYLAYPYAVESDNPRKKNIDWLKSLPERFNLQPKQEWSEENKMNIELLIALLRGKVNLVEILDSRKESIINFLKSLRPTKDCTGCSKHLEGYISGRSDAENKLLDMYGILLMPDGELRMKPTWKPSEEQMEALNALNCHGDLSYVGQQKQLISLYNDLKKLM